jgi:hypothetical protein
MSAFDPKLPRDSSEHQTHADEMLSARKEAVQWNALAVRTLSSAPPDERRK